MGEGGGSDAEEEGEANRRVDSPPSADERDVERVDEDAAPAPAEDEKEDEDVGQSQSQQKSAKEMQTKPKRAGFFARMFGGGGKKKGESRGAAVVSGPETDRPEPRAAADCFEAGDVRGRPKGSLRRRSSSSASTGRFGSSRRRFPPVRSTLGETSHRLVTAGAGGGTTRYDATRVIVALRDEPRRRQGQAGVGARRLRLVHRVRGGRRRQWGGWD